MGGVAYLMSVPMVRIFSKPSLGMVVVFAIIIRILGYYAVCRIKLSEGRYSLILLAKDCNPFEPLWADLSRVISIGYTCWIKGLGAMRF